MDASDDEDGKEIRYETPFADGRFLRFCEIRGGDAAGLASIVAQLEGRTVKRWSRGVNMPAAKSWLKVAQVFGFADSTQLWLAFADFLRAQRSATPFAETAAQLAVDYRVGVERPLAEAVREACRPLSRIADLDLLEIKPKSRRENLESSRAKILQILALLESEYQDFCRQLEK